MTDLINCEGGVLHCFMPELVNSHDTHDSEITFWALAGILTIIASSFLCSKADERNSNNFHILAALGQISALAFLQQGRLVQPVDTPISNAVLKSLLSLIAAMWALSRLLAGIQKISAAFIAKRTVLWKLFHVRNGTYETAVRKLHEQYGDVVQVGPYELSISNAAYFERCARFEKATPSRLPTQDRTAHSPFSLGDALAMANVFHYERDIQACNRKLLDNLRLHAGNGNTVKMPDLIACYAYDVLFATTTGQQAGFLDRPRDATKVARAIRDWKFHSVLYGSYLRFHPLIDAAVKLIDGSKNFEAGMLRCLPDDLGATMRGVAAHMSFGKGSEEGEERSDLLPACMAMIVAGSDPLITHITSTLFCIYRDPELLRQLRAELRKLHIQKPPNLKYLLKCKQKLPLLHAVLQESLRLSKPHTNGFSYVAPEGGIVIGEKHVPQGCTICLEPSLAHLDSSVFGPDADDFNPHRWLLDSNNSERMRGHMLPQHLPIVVRRTHELKYFVFFLPFQLDSSSLHTTHEHEHILQSSKNFIRTAFPALTEQSQPSHSTHEHEQIPQFLKNFIRTASPARTKHHQRLTGVKFGSGTKHCPGEDLHKAIILKLITQILPNFDLDFKMAATGIPTTPASMSVGDLRDLCNITVSIPKDVVDANPPPSPLRATAPAFAPGATTTPLRKSVFSLDTTGKIEALVEYLMAFKNAKVFVPNAAAQADVAKIAGNTAPSPTLSNATTASRESPISDGNRHTLGKILGNDTVDELLNRFDPSRELTAAPSVRSRFPVHDPHKQGVVQKIIRRVWGGRLYYRIDPKTNKMWFERSRNYVRDNLQNNNGTDKPTVAPRKPRAPIHAAWGAFAETQDAEHTEVRERTAEEARNSEVFKAKLKANEEAWKARQEAMKDEPQTVFKQVFKLTGADTRNGKLGGPRKHYDVVETPDARTNGTEPQQQDGGVALPVTEQAAAEKPKAAALPPHLRKRAVSPPHLRNKIPEAATTDGGDAAGAKKTEKTEKTSEWVAARLPTPSA